MNDRARGGRVFASQTQSNSPPSARIHSSPALPFRLTPNRCANARYDGAAPANGDDRADLQERLAAQDAAHASAAAQSKRLVSARAACEVADGAADLRVPAAVLFPINVQWRAAAAETLAASRRRQVTRKQLRLLRQLHGVARRDVLILRVQLAASMDTRCVV